jgi:TRAP-type C4-dicarboxylate transport system permease small subunit
MGEERHLSDVSIPREDATPPPRRGWVRAILLGIGSVGMLVAMASDAIAVLGRHVGFTLPGSIEVFQVAAVVALSMAILLASLNDRHAAVDLLVGRASPRTARALFLFGRLALTLAFALLCAGSIWVSADLWSTREMTEILAIPLRPFRLFWILCSGVAALHFALQFVKALRR